MNDMNNLYRQIIMDHYKSPRHKGLKGYKCEHLHNPSCGDDITVEAKIENGKVVEVNHDGAGCSICCSSASVMSELLSGKSVEEAKEIIEDYFNMIKGEEIEDPDRLEDALVYQGVAQFPARMKCATISWQALKDVINDDTDGDKKDE